MSLEEIVAMGNKLSRLTDQRSAIVKQLRAAQKSGSSTTKIESDLAEIEADIATLKTEIEAARKANQPSLAVPDKKPAAPTAGDPLKKAEEEGEPESVIGEKERTRLGNLYDSLKEAGQIEAGVTKEDFINSGGDRKPPSAYKTGKVKSLLG
jgi:hypothetical protein